MKTILKDLPTVRQYVKARNTYSHLLLGGSPAKELSGGTHVYLEPKLKRRVIVHVPHDLGNKELPRVRKWMDVQFESDDQSAPAQWIPAPRGTQSKWQPRSQPQQCSLVLNQRKCRRGGEPSNAAHFGLRGERYFRQKAGGRLGHQAAETPGLIGPHGTNAR